MAIKIPSKSIYSVENPKIRDNIINRVDINCTKPTSTYITEKYNVYDDILDINTNETYYDSYKGQSAYIGGEGTNTVEYHTAYLKTLVGYNKISNVIDRFKNNYYLKSVKLGYSSDNTPNIQTIITYIKKEIPVKHTFVNIFSNLIADSGWNYSIIDNFDWEDFTINGEIKTTTSYSQVLEPINYYQANKRLIVNLIGIIKDKSTINYVNIATEERKQITLNYDLLTSYKTLKLQAEHKRDRSVIPPDYESVEFFGEIIEVVPQTLQICVKGTIITIDLEDFSLQVGNGDNPFKVDNNELMQTTNFLSNTNENALESQYTNLLEQYKNGKETAVINCSISEYKDQDGNVVINPKESEKMIFEMYDIVIPYKQGFVNGVQQDVPLSKYPNGEPKQFQVLGVKPHTSGVLRQELTLQEISQSTLQNK